MRIIRHSPTGGRNTEFVKGDRTRVNIKVNPSLQYADGIELAASIDDATTATVYLRWDDLREIVQFIRKSGTVRQKELLGPLSSTAGLGVAVTWTCGFEKPEASSAPRDHSPTGDRRKKTSL